MKTRISRKQVAKTIDTAIDKIRRLPNLENDALTRWASKIAPEAFAEDTRLLSAVALIAIDIVVATFDPLAHPEEDDRCS